jgi:hypothetical protein
MEKEGDRGRLQIILMAIIVVIVMGCEVKQEYCLAVW